MKDAYRLYEEARVLIDKSDIQQKDIFIRWLRALYTSINDKDFDINTKCFLFFKKNSGAVNGLFDKINKLTGEIYNKANN